MGAKLEQAAIAGSVALARMTEELLNHSPQFFVCFQGLALFDLADCGRIRCLRIQPTPIVVLIFEKWTGHARKNPRQ
jgi:hypothetical protein